MIFYILAALMFLPHGKWEDRRKNHRDERIYRLEIRVEDPSNWPSPCGPSAKLLPTPEC